MDTFRSRYHEDRRAVMHRGLSPRCHEIVSLRPEMPAPDVVCFPFSVDSHRHVFFVQGWTLPTPWSGFDHFCLLGVAMAEAYRLAEICTPRRILVPWYGCDPWEAAWWNDDAKWYLQQKFYLEGWSFAELPMLTFHGGRRAATHGELTARYLLAVSGGKESTFAYEWLRRAALDFEALTLHYSGGVYGTDWEKKFPVLTEVRAATRLHELRMYHETDPAARFGYHGVRNDPTITNVLFGMLSIAATSGTQYVVMAHDRGAEEQNASHEGETINHQSAKGSVYTHRFNELLAHRGIAMRYVSLCQNAYSIGTVWQLAAWRPDVVALLTSCNEAQWMPGAIRWCQRCPKCAFSYALIESVLGREAAMRIVGSDLLVSEHLQPTWQALYDPEREKPFECVGEKREVAFALSRIHRNRAEAGAGLGASASVPSELPAVDLLDISAPETLPTKHRIQLDSVLTSICTKP